MTDFDGNGSLWTLEGTVCAERRQDVQWEERLGVAAREFPTPKLTKLLPMFL